MHPICGQDNLKGETSVTRNKYDDCMSKFRIGFPQKKIDNEPPKLVFAMRSCIGDAQRMDSIMVENKALLKRLCSIYRSAEPAVPTVKHCNKRWKKWLQDLMNQSKHPFQFALKERVWWPLPSLVPQEPENECAPRQRAFMEFTSSQGRNLGRIELELFIEKAPKTCRNFLAFVSGRGPGDSSYINSGFYQILPGYYVMGGDVVKNNGTGVLSVDGEVTFADEKNDLSHCEPGILCTPGLYPDSCDSKFMITVKPLTVIDEKSTVFGRVILGFDVLNAINACGSKPSGKVTTKVFCSNCDRIRPKGKSKSTPNHAKGEE